MINKIYGFLSNSLNVLGVEVHETKDVTGGRPLGKSEKNFTMIL